MKEEWLKMMERIKLIEPDTSPNFITLKAFYNKLTEHFSDQAAVEIVGCIKIDVCQEFVEDQELLNKTLDAYVCMLVKTWDAFSEINSSLFSLMMKQQGLTLEYKV